MRKFLTLTFIGFLLILNLNFVQGSFNSYQKLSEISKEQVKVKDLEEKNSDLKRELELRNSTYFIEQEARNRLGYSRAGETSIIIEGSVIKQAGDKRQEEQRNNIESWLDLIRL